MDVNTFRANILKPGVHLRIRFLYNGTDYTTLIKDGGIGMIRRDLNLSAGRATVQLDNSRGTWNTLKAGRDSLGNSAQIDLYIDGDTTNILTLLKGTVDRVQYNMSVATITIRDHAGKWLDLKVGSNRQPVNYYTTARRVNELVWAILTDHAELDATEDPSNPDIDYASFARWRDDHIVPNKYYLDAKPTGETVQILLGKICQRSHSYMWIDHDGKVAFAPPYGEGYSYDEENSAGGRNLLFEVKNLYNDVTVMWGFNYTLGTWLGNYSGTDSDSITQYGTRPITIEDRVITHSKSDSAEADKDAIVTDYAWPHKYYEVKAGPPAMMEDLGREIRVTDTLKKMSDIPIIEKIDYDLNRMQVSIQAKAPSMEPEITGPTAPTYNDVVVDGRYMYACYVDSTDGNGGILVFNIADVGNPYRIGHLVLTNDTNDAPLRVRKYKDWLYTSWRYGFRGVGVEDPSNPTIGHVQYSRVCNSGVPTVALTIVEPKVYVWWQGINTGLYQYVGDDGSSMKYRAGLALNWTHYDTHVGGHYPNTCNAWYTTPSSGHAAVFATHNWVVSDGLHAVFSQTNAGGAWRVGYSSPAIGYDIVTNDRGPESRGQPICHAAKNNHLYCHSTVGALNLDYSYCYTVGHAHQTHCALTNAAPPGGYAKMEIDDKYSNIGYIVGHLGCTIIDLVLAEVKHTLSGTFRGQVARNHFLYVCRTSPSDQIDIYDVSDPENPELAGTAI